MALLLRQIGSSVIVMFSHSHFALLFMTSCLRPFLLLRVRLAALSIFRLGIPFVASGFGFAAAGVLLGFDWAKTKPVIMVTHSHAGIRHHNRRIVFRRFVR